MVDNFNQLLFTVGRQDNIVKTENRVNPFGEVRYTFGNQFSACFPEAGTPRIVGVEILRASCRQTHGVF